MRVLTETNRASISSRKATNVSSMGASRSDAPISWRQRRQPLLYRRRHRSPEHLRHPASLADYHSATPVEFLRPRGSKAQSPRRRSLFFTFSRGWAKIAKIHTRGTIQLQNAASAE
jgi:hypothetical protein